MVSYLNRLINLKKKSMTELNLRLLDTYAAKLLQSAVGMTHLLCCRLVMGCTY